MPDCCWQKLPGSTSRQAMIDPRLIRLFLGSKAAVPLSSSQQEALARFRQKVRSGIYRQKSVSCLCGAGGGRLVGLRDRYGIAITTRLCTHCGVLRTDPQMTDDTLRRFYAEDYRPLYVGEARPTVAFFEAQKQHGRELLRRFADSVTSSMPPVVYDIGCGAGGVLMPFAEAGWHAIGCDPGGAYLELGRAKGLELYHGNVDALAECPKPDLVILSHVLEHIPDPDAFLAELTRRLAPGGLIYIELPGIYAIKETYRSVLRFLQNAHLYHFTLGTLANLLAKHGFILESGDEQISASFRHSENAVVPLRPVDANDIYRHLGEVEVMAMREDYYDFMRAHPQLNRIRLLLGKTNRRRLLRRLQNGLKNSRD